MVAAVDLARVRLPVHVEGVVAEEEEAVEVEIRQQKRETTAEKHVAIKTLPAEPPAAVAVTSEQHTVQVAQVGGVWIYFSCNMITDYKKRVFLSTK